MKPIEDKNFLNFLGKPLIQHQIEMIRKAGFKDILVIGGKHNLGKLEELGVEVMEQKDLELGMCGAVLTGKKWLGKEPVLVLSSNDVVDLKALQLIKKASAGGEAESYILGKKVVNYFPGGYLKVDKKGFISEVVEKPEPGREPSDLINLVVHVHKNPAELVKYLENVKSKRDDKYEVALSQMMKDGVKMKAVEYEGFWQPVKYPWHIHEVFKHLFRKAEKGISKTAQVAKNAIINGDVIIGERVKIFDGAVVNGPCYIGDDCIIATNALVRESHLGNGCIAGFSTEIARSFLGREVWTHSNYVGDSIIGDNVSFGAGTVTGNLRLDEKEVEIFVEGKKVNAYTNKFGAIIGDHVRVGVNTSLMPGIKIGSGSFIGAGLVVAQDIEENSFVRGTWELKISKNTVDVSEMGRGEFKKKL